MDFKKLAAAYAGLAAGHSLGHLSTANKTGAPASLHATEGAEYWERPESEYNHTLVKGTPYFNPATGTMIPAQRWIRTTARAMPVETDRNAAGFQTQDELTRAVDSPEASLANALYKTIYLSGGGGMIGGRTDDDVTNTARNSGVSADKIRALAGFSALADFYNAAHPDNTAKVGFSTLSRGTPGLTFSVPVDQNLIPVFNRNSKRK